MNDAQLIQVLSRVPRCAVEEVWSDILSDSGCTYNIFGISKNSQDPSRIGRLKDLVSDRIERYRYIQVIGDSATPFDREESARVYQYISSILSTHIDHAVIWGVTGIRDSRGCMDINGLVNAWIDENPTERWPRCIGCLVDRGSMEAVHSGYGFPSAGSPTKNFIVVHGGAEFGDDTPTTDMIADITVCVEGGIQSFCQLVGTLSRGGQVIVKHGFRSNDFPQRVSLRLLYRTTR
jgi:hypothetical protein